MLNIAMPKIRSQGARVMDEVDAMEPRAFEKLVLQRSMSLGWVAARTPITHDGGADGLLVHAKTKARVIVQCKHKQRGDRACGAEAVDDLLRARSGFGPDARLFALTNASFSTAARDRALSIFVEITNLKFPADSVVQSTRYEMRADGLSALRHPVRANWTSDQDGSALGERKSGARGNLRWGGIVA
jgi:Restriction endonuclease